MAYNKRAKIKNKLTEREEPPNEKLMRSIEIKINVTESSVNDFRRSIASFIGDRYHSGKEVKWDSDPQLKLALEAKLFEDIRSHIKLSTLSEEANITQPDIQEKIDAVKKRLIDQYGYNDRSATDVLEYVGSLLSSGENSEYE
jgi:serine protein kinase